MTKHPAKYTDALLPVFASMLAGNEHLLDPFGGTGKIYSLLRWHPNLIIDAVEIEKEWAELDSRITLGDALNLQWDDDTFDAVVTSPCYGNRMADSYHAKDASKRHTYRTALGRELSEGSAGMLQWGRRYRHFHIQAWKESRRVLRGKGKFILNIKDHVRAGVVQKVTAWHIETLRLMGFEVVDHKKVPVPSMRHGQNANKRIEFESVIKLILYK